MTRERLRNPRGAISGIPGRMTRLGIGMVFLSLGAELAAQDARILEIENIVQASQRQAGWKPAVEEQTLQVRDRVRTRQRSRATVRLSDLYTLRMDRFTTIEITPQLVGKEKPRLDFARGKAYIFSREPDGEIDIKTPAVNAALRGTQLVVEVSENGFTKIQVLEGAVEMSNLQGRLGLRAGEAGEANVGEAPRRTAAIEARNILQWALYYPAVLDADEIGLTAAERRRVAASLTAYESGDLLGALELYPDNAPASTGGRLYQAGVLLAVGRVDEARAIIGRLPKGNPHTLALERMIAAVLFEEQAPAAAEPATVAAAIAESYYQQSRSRLEEARAAAVLATELKPENGYAWTRLAELEFSFGRLKASEEALQRALAFTPRNARTHALHGFVLSGQNCLPAAHQAFQNAIDLDGALASGWLGRGLIKIRTGNRESGLQDLQTAATVEPTMSIYHSYLGKGFSDHGLGLEGRRDFDLAKQIDPHDPTPWLYSALDLNRANRTNEAIGDLAKSVELNDYRRVYRSRFLLDQDRAVRSANLAQLYQDAGMFEVAVREATRAVESDYTNSSSHLFLANAFDALRDPRRIELRYETPWFNELLLANLLSPVGGGPLSQFVSQQEYSKLFQQQGIGGSFSTEYRSTSETRSALSLYGTAGNVDFGIDGYYGQDDGDRLNNEDTLKEVYAQFKWQVTPSDIFYFLGKWGEQDSGDNFRTYNNLPLSPGLDFEERQEPGLLLAGWNHQWQPGVNTLFLAGRLSAEQRLTDPATTQLLVGRSNEGLNPGFIHNPTPSTVEFTDPALRNAVPPSVEVGPDFETVIYSDDLLRAITPYVGTGSIEFVDSAPFAFDTWRDFEIYTAEVQQVIETEGNTLLAGARWQGGEFRTDTLLEVHRPTFAGGFPTPAARQSEETDFDRLTLYLYDYWQVRPGLTLIGGLAWDHLEYPDNFRLPPVNSQQRDNDKLSGKAGFTYTPSRHLAIRGAYTEGLGGVSFDESVRLEPTQLAGFNQAFRTVISESLIGSVEAPDYRNFGLSADGILGDRTWWGATWQTIEQDVDRTYGAFSGYDTGGGLLGVEPAFFPDGIAQRLDYREHRLALTLNHLIGNQFAVGARYRLTYSDLEMIYPELVAAGAGIPSVVPARENDKATLHEVSIYGNWYSPAGWFARVEGNWFSQDLDDDPKGSAQGGPDRSDEDFIQFNAFAGYRFAQRQAEISAGILNIGDQDYNLSPLNPYPEIAPERTFVLRCRVSF